MMSEPVRLAIVGSTSFKEPYAPMLAEWIIKRALVFFDPVEVISGGAKGVDSWAEGLAKAYGFPTCIYMPGQRQWEPNGYKARNLRIAKACTHLIAIRCAQSRTYGSGYTADRAEQMGKSVYRRII